LNPGEFDVTIFGIKMIIVFTPPFVGVLHSLWTAQVAEFHGRLYVDPLTPPSGRVQRVHLRRKCADCGFHAELRSMIRS